MIDRYQGDPKLILTEYGADLVFKGGQPVMDAGLENAVMISLFTRRGWAGNIFFDDTEEQIGSDYLDKFNQAITFTMINDVRIAAEKALEWMVEAGLASNIAVTVTNPRGIQIDTMILIQPPGKDLKVLLATKNGTNWIFQKVDPANLRI